MMRPFHLVVPGAVPALAAGMAAAAPEVADAGATLLRNPAPNPGVTGSNLSFTLRNPGNVEIDLYTVTGQHVQRIAGGWYGAGDHSVIWQRRAKSGEALANGVYIVRFRGDGVQQSEKLVLAR